MKTALVTIRIRMPVTDYCEMGENITNEEIASLMSSEGFDFPILYRELKAGTWELEGIDYEVSGEWEEG